VPYRLVQWRKRHIYAAPFVHDELTGIAITDDFRKFLPKLDSGIGYAAQNGGCAECHHSIFCHAYDQRLAKICP
jgi:hypothetical protein